MTKKERIDAAIRSLLVTVSQITGKDPDKVLEELSDEIKRLRHQFNAAPSWTRSPPCTISRLKRTSSLQIPYRLRATVIYLSEPFMVYLPVEGGNLEPTLVAHCQLRDTIGDQVETVAITNEALIHDIRSAMHQHAELEFLGQLIAVPSIAGTYLLRFCIFEMRTVSTTLQVVNATTSEIRTAKTTLRKLKKAGQTPLAHIRSLIVDGLEIAALEDHPLLALALDFTILQALSSGTVGNASGKLNGLIVGAPGSGKKLLNLSARVANINFREGHPTKLTPAGLSGSTRLTGDGFISDPGLLPLAHMGAVSIQDAHSIPPRSNAGIYAALSMVMEDGVVMDSTAARRTFEAETSVLLDLNRRSDLGRQVNDTHEDIGIPLNVLSRFDSVFVFPADATRQADVALSLHAKLGCDNGTRRHLDDEEWVREIRVLVAYLRDHLQPETSTVVLTARALHADLIRNNEGCLALSDFQTRLANSVWKFVRAICRGWNRKIADEEVVHEAYRFLAPKIEFLRSLDPAIRVPRSWTPKTRREWVQDTYAGVETTPEEVAERYQRKSGSSVDPRTIRRYLKELGATQPRRGVFLLPPARGAA